MGQTSTTQGTKSGGLSCLAQKLGSTSTPCPSSGRTHVTSCLASPGPHTAEHSPASDTCHLWTRGKWLSKTLEVSRFFFQFHPVRFVAARFSAALPGGTVVRVTPFDGVWGRAGRAMGMRNAQLAVAVQPHASHWPHFFSSTARGAAGPKRSRFPPGTGKRLCCCPTVSVFFDRRAAPH